MRRFFVEVTDEAFDALADIASTQRRDVRDQAALILELALASMDNPAVRAALPPEGDKALGQVSRARQAQQDGSGRRVRSARSEAPDALPV